MKSMIRTMSMPVALVMLFSTVPALANTGTVTQLSGTLSVRKADGSVRILSQKSTIQSGDTVNTERDSYAQIKFSDGAQVTLKPNTAVKLDNFKFQEDKPAEDSFLYSLVKGGLRAVTGVVGKRSRDAYRLGNGYGDHRYSRHDPVGG
jgi:hypothetical protein